MGFVSFMEDIVDRMGRDNPSSWNKSIRSEASEILSAEEIGQRLNFLQEQRQALEGQLRDQKVRLNSANIVDRKWPIIADSMANRNATRPLKPIQVEKQAARTAIKITLEKINCIKLLIDKLNRQETNN